MDERDQGVKLAGRPQGCAPTKIRPRCERPCLCRGAPLRSPCEPNGTLFPLNSSFPDLTPIGKPQASPYYDIPHRVSVVIVGAGPTGLTAANLLGMAGIETLLIERNEHICDFPRAIALDDEGLRICQATGLMDALHTHMRSDVKAHYVSRGRFLARVEPTEQGNGHPLISTFHQPTLERVLLKGIERFSCVKVLFCHRLEAFEQDEGGVRISVCGPEDALAYIECDYLLACDGGKSTIRHALDIVMQPSIQLPFQFPERPQGSAPIDGKLPGRPQGSAPTMTGTLTMVTDLCRGVLLRSPWYSLHITNSIKRADTTGQKWLVVDCSGNSEPSDTIIFFCNPGRPAVSVPGPGLQRRWEFMLLPGESEEDLLQNETISALIRRTWRSMPRGHYITGMQPIPPFQIIRKAIYTFHALTATKLSKGRVFLLGDAAHLMPPFGGQGMNSGLRDAHNLCWKLQLVLQERANPKLLASYHKERHLHVTQMILFSWLLGKIIMPTKHGIAFLRDIFFQSVNRITLVRRAIREMHVKPQPRYKRGFLLAHKGEDGKLVGTMLPQPYVLNQEGKRVLLDTILGDSFALLTICEDSVKAFEGLRHEVWGRLRVQFVCVQTADTHRLQEANQWRCVVDVDQQLSAFLGTRRDLYVLVRPDRYVMGVFRVEQALQFELALKKLIS